VAGAQQRAHALDLAVRDADGQGSERAAAEDAADVGSGLDQRADQVAAPLAVRGLQRRVAAVDGLHAAPVVSLRALVDHAPLLLLAGAAGDRVVDRQKIVGVACCCCRCIRCCFFRRRHFLAGRFVFAPERWHTDRFGCAQ